MYALGILAGGLAITGLISRLLLIAMRSWQSTIIRPIMANGTTWLLAALLAGMGMADGGAFAGARAAGLYAIPCGLWLLIDLVLALFRRP